MMAMASVFTLPEGVQPKYVSPPQGRQAPVCPLMLSLMTAKSIADAVHVFLRGKASFGGGPVGSACGGDEFEFPAMVGGGVEKSIDARSDST